MWPHASCDAVSVGAGGAWTLIHVRVGIAVRSNNVVIAQQGYASYGDKYEVVPLDVISGDFSEIIAQKLSMLGWNTVTKEQAFNESGTDPMFVYDVEKTPSERAIWKI
ncbi:hypothetical protein SCP_0303800 [Sparassis crispa]|uniref:Uncharacterized protein n=1 Tax=Sparassis crispa TaxID=139825 RepID=A0A401GEU2_9APHY|nr:hypothetical protein SCP_0303800 [Sparassis crispa]GBE80661.1 hypothetical protein SCP_0303800 [Sparassis crispa]